MNRIEISREKFDFGVKIDLEAEAAIYTARVALDHLHLRIMELNVEKLNFWSKLAKEYGFDITKKKYRIQEIDGKCYVLEGEE